MSVFARLDFNFDTTKFNGADTLSSGAANTLILVANTMGTMTDWQKSDISNGAIVRADYLQNPLENTINSLVNVAIEIYNLSSSVNGNVANLIISSNTLSYNANSFLSHTNNISGVSIVTDSTFPSFASAHSIGQLNMINLSKTDGVTNTVPILGSFTSLFIGEDLTANLIQITSYRNEFANTISSGNSNVTTQRAEVMYQYMSDTANNLNERLEHDINFFRNSLQVSKDISFLQQFTNMGGTMTYLVENLVGTENLKNKLNS